MIGYYTYELNRISLIKVLFLHEVTFNHDIAQISL